MKAIHAQVVHSDDIRIFRKLRQKGQAVWRIKFCRAYGYSMCLMHVAANAICA
jgi:hypothetical protein